MSSNLPSVPFDSSLVENIRKTQKVHEEVFKDRIWRRNVKRIGTIVLIVAVVGGGVALLIYMALSSAQQPPQQQQAETSSDNNNA